jgi:hypothetical protein
MTHALNSIANIVLRMRKIKVKNHSSDAKPDVADGFAGERFPYAETRFKTGGDFEGLG